MNAACLDFIGQEIQVGGWVASTGGGNLKAEYGSILYKVLAASSGKLRVQRLTGSYPDGKNFQAKAVASTVTSTNKYVVVHPKDSVIALFESVVNGTGTEKDHAKVGRWLHGQEALHWA